MHGKIDHWGLNQGLNSDFHARVLTSEFQLPKVRVSWKSWLGVLLALQDWQDLWDTTLNVGLVPFVSPTADWLSMDPLNLPLLVSSELHDLTLKDHLTQWQVTFIHGLFDLELTDANIPNFFLTKFRIRSAWSLF